MSAGSPRASLSIDHNVSVRQDNLLIDAELVIFENVLGTQGLITAVFQTFCRVLQAIGGGPAGPALEVAHVGAQAGLVHDRNDFGIRVQRHFVVVGSDVSAVARTVEQIAVGFAVGTYAGPDGGRVLEHAHRVASRRNGVDHDVIFTGLEILLLDLGRQTTFIGHSKTGGDLHCGGAVFKKRNRIG